MAENKNPKKHQPWELEQMQSCPLYIKEPMSERRIMDWYYDAKQPWKTRVDNIDDCKETIAVCTYLIANIANLLHPFLPFSSQKVSEWLGTTLEWEEQTISVEKIPSDISILFSKVE